MYTGLVLYPLGLAECLLVLRRLKSILGSAEGPWAAFSTAAHLVSPYSTLAHVEKFFNLRDHYTGFIFHLDREDRLILLECLQLLADLLDLCVGQTKFRTDGSASRPLVADGRGLVPDNVIASQVMHQHEHIESVGHGKQ